MPYISENHRKNLDNCIDQMVLCLKNNVPATDEHPYPSPFNLNLDNEQMLGLSGDINYCFSRILAGLMGTTSYPKIAVITGVLENIKQEFYRRVATPYEGKKILENGDIKEYKHM